MGWGWRIGGNESVSPGRADVFLGTSASWAGWRGRVSPLTPSELIAPFRDLVKAVVIGLL